VSEQLGTLVREGVAATNIREEGDSRRVDAGGETYEAPVLVDAAGAWGGRIASSASGRAPSWPS
jgi:sarcosine oxidase subunit beta